MAGTDSGGVNERLNGLISLLQSVGIDGVDSDALLDQQRRSKTKSNSNRSTPKKKAVDDSAAASSSDAQILEIVKKLQQAQMDSPEIFEALKSPELLALASLAAQTKGASAPEPAKPVATSLDDVIDVDDDNYPKIGPGYSDDISVVSELSTPTVMSRQSIPEEEYYREVNTGGGISSLPGGLAGSRLSRATPNRAGLGGGKLPAGKTRNMVGQVRPLAPRRSIPGIAAIPPKPTGGGAAAQRRLNYQMAMSKLESDGFASPTQDNTQPNSPSATGTSKDGKKLAKAPARTVSGTKSIGSGSGGGGSKRKPRSINSKIKTSDDINWGTTDEDGWPAFEDLKNNNSTTDFFVDSDGFFSDNVFSNDGSVGPTTSTSSKSRKKKSDKSSSRSADGSASSGNKKKASREGNSTRKSHRVKKDRDSERPLSDDDREGSTRRSHRLKKEKDKDALSDDGLGTSRKSKTKKDKDKDKEKSGRRKARRASMV
mmetsp:Transcript_14112/g.32838  ORF Transcript_14112/g.32838 Transcript_14112/m.32838 type:complete len:485 (-) Transcript_14112:3071-4525(-)|eukprot:CAMPEP_0197178632 /NCGR_PEP_ID=MMETSP1423-20130617/3853_1 /TAXON_ID=476441 /ORGANISM="Pseudo-nitzschia heimii, Strain UNC1101" /LENGTH=484 /DNA_ID=CAMNT_0042628411 /DNA_START=276 /DNA_END=1730 /DNA_ORIENTATION=-